LVPGGLLALANGGRPIRVSEHGAALIRRRSHARHQNSVHNASRRLLVLADAAIPAQHCLGLSEGEMPKRIVTPTTNSSRQFNFLVPDDVIDAVERYIDCAAPGRIVSTYSAVQSVRGKIPDCGLSDEQIERYAVLCAVDEALAVHFDRRGSSRDPYSPLSRTHWRLVPRWKIEARTRLAHVLFHRPPSRPKTTPVGGTATAIASDLSALHSENSKGVAGRLR